MKSAFFLLPSLYTQYYTKNKNGCKVLFPKAAAKAAPISIDAAFRVTPGVFGVLGARSWPFYKTRYWLMIDREIKKADGQRYWRSCTGSPFLSLARFV